jgi:hypothetical protein
MRLGVVINSTANALADHRPPIRRNGSGDLSLEAVFAFFGH